MDQQLILPHLLLVHLAKKVDSSIMEPVEEPLPRLLMGKLSLIKSKQEQKVEYFT